LDAFN
jgi:hypothetical protein